jgi:hypothetical protein
MFQTPKKDVLFPPFASWAHEAWAKCETTRRTGQLVVADWLRPSSQTSQENEE